MLKEQQKIFGLMRDEEENRTEGITLKPDNANKSPTQRVEGIQSTSGQETKINKNLLDLFKQEKHLNGS